jgi:protein-S-isoprenylcysteine O-methyltransferase Ste14
MSSIIPIIIWPFVALGAFWLITWTSVKKTSEEQKASGWFLYWILSVIGALLIVFAVHFPTFSIPLIQSSPTLHLSGFLVAVLGLCIAIWARITLGKNWSSRVTFKEKHELITTGPYRWVRHPIYTGITTMCLGTAIYFGVLIGFIAMIFFFLSFWIKSKQEEALMIKHFPKEYKNYKKNTKAIIPFIY